MIINNKQQLKQKIDKGFLRLSFEDNGELNLKYTSKDNLEQVQFILNRREIKDLYTTLQMWGEI